MKWIIIVLLLLPFTTDAQIITTIAGDTTWGFSGDGGLSTHAQCKQTTNVITDTFGNVFFVDCLNNRVRKINTSGVITTVAGDGTEGFFGDGVPATSTGLDLPWGIAVDRLGNMYIGDRENHRIRKVNTSGIISTIAGTGTPGYGGDGGPAAIAQLQGPRSVIVDRIGNVYFSDAENHIVRKIDTAGVIRTFAGNRYPSFGGDGGQATNASLFFPSGLVMDVLGNIFIADQYNHRIRKVTPSGIISTVAGTGINGYSGDGMAATASKLNYPLGIAIDTLGNIFIADEDNNRIRKVDPSGIITTVVGTGVAGFSGDGYAATLAEINRADGLFVDVYGSLFIADEINHCVRKVWIPLPMITGPLSLCIGSIITLSDSVSGGIWTSNNPLIATVSSTSGLVTGISSGIDTITYTLGSRSTMVIVTVNPIPVLSSTLTPPAICDTMIFNYFPTSLTPGTTFTWSRAPVIGISNPGSFGTGNPNELLSNTTSAPVTVTYAYILNASGCIDTQNVVVDILPCTPALSIDPVEKYRNGLAIYPNPAKDILFISSSNKISNVVIFNIISQKIISQDNNFNEVKIDVSGLTPGIYFIKINESDMVKLFKQ